MNRLRVDPDKLQQCVISMGKNIDLGLIEKVPLDEQTPPEGKAWWIPVLPVTHPKRGKVRIVFDSSAKYCGISLNLKLLQGPDINNRLKNVLLNFRDGEIGFMADIESMFYAFSVDKKDRDFLRFYWYEDNDPLKDVIQNRATVHVFGNAPSPAIAIFGLRYATTANEDDASCTEAKNFIQNSFYMDDGVAASNSSEQAIAILKDARKILGKYNRAVIPPKASSTKELDACGWDDPLPDKYKPSWEAWKSSLSSASAVSVLRSYTPAGFQSTDRQLHVFCDASEEAIGYAIYLRSQSSVGEICVSLVMGNSKVAPRGATSIPRMELCAAVEAARAAEETI
ncbi:hypothetical protein HAZT_HAZT000503 [Hyalella azteca]|uniref:Uncharacterized protein n=1 Tax=Hyalella azteca TaxID=294128 RepID=A0A6A0GW68_HYAAZ|nr:hypothetical protein HAZT_HAZT000503 [Hyalella azteca]